MADQDIADARDALEDLQIEYGHAQREARDLAVWLHKTYYADVTDWKPFNDASGLLTQIDNMVAGVRDRLSAAEASNAELIAQRDRLADVVQDMEDACEALAAARDQATYDAMVANGMTGALIDLDDARRAARATLTSIQAGGAK